MVKQITFFYVDIFFIFHYIIDLWCIDDNHPGYDGLMVFEGCDNWLDHSLPIAGEINTAITSLEIYRELSQHYHEKKIQPSREVMEYKHQKFNTTLCNVAIYFTRMETLSALYVISYIWRPLGTEVSKYRFTKYSRFDTVKLQICTTFFCLMPQQKNKTCFWTVMGSTLKVLWHEKSFFLIMVKNCVYNTMKKVI